jgi:Tol biopolymer transport system component
MHLATGGGDSAVRLWDVVSGEQLAELPTGEVAQHAAFSPDGGRLATASAGGQIIIWDVGARREVTRLESSEGRLVFVEFNREGNVLVSGSLSGTARSWDATTGEELGALPTSQNLPSPVFSPDGELAVVATTDNMAHIVKADGTKLKTLEGHQNRIVTAAFSPDGLLIATGSLDGTARLWSAPEGTAIGILEGHTNAVTAVAFSPEGRLLLTASRDGTVRTWSVAEKRQQAVFRGHSGVVNSAVFNPHGPYVVSASSQDRTVRLWEADTGREIAVLSSPPDEANRVALTRASFSPDGGRIAIVSGNKEVKVVRTFPTPRDLIDYARSVVPRDLTPCERQRFFLPVEGEPDCAH